MDSWIKDRSQHRRRSSKMVWAGESSKSASLEDQLIVQKSHMFNNHLKSIPSSNYYALNRSSDTMIQHPWASRPWVSKHQYVAVHNDWRVDKVLQVHHQNQTPTASELSEILPSAEKKYLRQHFISKGEHGQWNVAKKAQYLLELFGIQNCKHLSGSFCSILVVFGCKRRTTFREDITERSSGKPGQRSKRFWNSCLSSCV